MSCKDDDGCAQLYQTFQVAGEDICQKPGLKTFCNKTCSLCSGMTSSLPPTATHLDQCTLNPCVHGTCVSVHGTFSCICDTGNIGVLCDKGLRDCQDILDQHLAGHTNNETATIALGGRPTNVLCDMQTEDGGWTVLMNRHGNTTNFPDKTYTEYVVGFGDIHGDFWAGLEKMHNLTSDGRIYQLRVELEIANGTLYVANYDNFSIGPPDDFVLHIGRYHGNAGDSLLRHNGHGFTTKEVDHDINWMNCGRYAHGAWWFHSCQDSCLTCPYRVPGSSYKEDRCRVFSWNRLGVCIALKSARLLVRPM